LTASILCLSQVLLFPPPLLLVRQEPHLRRLALDPPSLLDGLEFPIDLGFVQGVLLVFAVFPFESGNVQILIPPDVVAEITVERSAMNLKERHLFVEAGGVHTGILGSLEPFQSLNRFVESAIDWQDCFVQMDLSHFESSFPPTVEALGRTVAEVLGHTYPDGMEGASIGRKRLSALYDGRRMLEQKGRSWYA
jgi:hypothetical protein